MMHVCFFLCVHIHVRGCTCGHACVWRTANNLACCYSDTRYWLCSHCFRGPNTYSHFFMGSILSTEPWPCTVMFVHDNCYYFIIVFSPRMSVSSYLRWTSDRVNELFHLWELIAVFNLWRSISIWEMVLRDVCGNSSWLYETGWNDPPTHYGCHHSLCWDSALYKRKWAEHSYCLVS